VSGRARRPAGLRLLNGAGAALRRLGVPLVRLAPSALLDAAHRRTGLTDFGDDQFREPLVRLLTALEHEARLTVLGRLIARDEVVRLLVNRLRVQDLRRRHPEIDAERIEEPLFIVGLPRTGTTILHELLAQDPANRVPMTWEVMHPVPPPEAATFDTDPRIADVERHFARIDRLMPDFRSMHPMGARLPQECVAITQHEFASLVWPTTHRVPTYAGWLDSADHRPVYGAHRRWLQYLQWKAPARRWVLKSPGHLWTLDALLAIYPDARIVQTHRDPLCVVASLVSLVCTLRGVASDDVDPIEVAAEWSPRLARGLARTMEVRARGLLPSERVIDVQFAEFGCDEIGMVRRIYAHFGSVLSPEAEARMRGYLAQHGVERRGRHRYTLALGGLDERTERARYAEYQERYGVPSERVA
jgi:sulfotransferase family protein